LILLYEGYFIVFGGNCQKSYSLQFGKVGRLDRILLWYDHIKSGDLLAIKKIVSNPMDFTLRRIMAPLDNNKKSHNKK